MIIDRNAGVTPNRYQSQPLRRTIGKRIGRADRDDMLQALLWVSEVRIADDLVLTWRRFRQAIEREKQEAQLRRDKTRWQLDQVTVLAHEAADKLLKELADEVLEAGQALAECEQALQALRNRLGKSPHYEQDRLSDLRTVLSALSDQLPTAKERLAALLTMDIERLRPLAELEQRQSQAPIETSVPLHQIDDMKQDDFEQVIRRALERSGYHIVSAAPKALEVAREAFNGIVFCDHARRPASNQSTGVEQIAAAQRLAAERGYSSVLVISNLRFISHPAHRLTESREPAVEMIQRFDLQRWLEWGEPLNDLVVWA
ncbi:restriction endonuclease [Streptomyces tanashiensis]|uniref:restriction endonuclease n=1 Tax=Streptomyces tanashiensis TaxID=67367 RepID=UPI0036EBC03A